LLKNNTVGNRRTTIRRKWLKKNVSLNITGGNIYVSERLVTISIVYFWLIFTNYL